MSGDQRGLEVVDIHKSLPDGRAVLRGISFSLSAGEFLGILGPSGAGKSLTMRCILGLTRPNSGCVHLRESDGNTSEISTSSGRQLRQIRRKIGVVFQGFNLVKRLSVLENVMIGRLGAIHPLRSWLYGFTDDEADGAMAALERIGMGHFAPRVTATLSGGEMQRVAVARALYQEPLLLLADEPIASLDPKNANEIMQLLRPIAEEIPICGVFHQPEMTAKYCTRVIGIRDGQIVYDGDPALSAQQLRELYGQELKELQRDTSAAELSQPTWAAISSLGKG
jgi:phosphonate transport system ATP-binding protein